MSYLYVAIGDSLTTGFGTFPGQGFAPVYRRMAEARLRTRIGYHNLGVNGLTTAELEKRISQSPEYRQKLTEADLITVSIGGNDLIQAARAAQRTPQRARRIMRDSLESSSSNLNGIIRQIFYLKYGARRPYIIRVVGLYNPYPSVSEAAEWVVSFNQRAMRLGGLGFGFADIYPVFYGREREYLFLDGIHPNRRGYYRIAERVNQLGYGPLR